MKQNKLLFLILLLLVTAGCNRNGGEEPAPPTPEPEDTMIEFKSVNNGIDHLIEGTWEVFSEYEEGAGYNEITNYSHIQYTMAHYDDYLYFTELRKTQGVVRIAWLLDNTKNSYGYEMATRWHDMEDSKLWLIYLNGDTLCYTSPEYPPRFTWKAIRVDSLDLAPEYMDSRYDALLSGVQCMPAAVTGEPYDITGRWKLLKDVSLDADYSCKEVIFDFRADSALTVTGDDADYPAGEYKYSSNGRLHISTYPEPYKRLTEYAGLRDGPILSPPPNLSIDGKELFCSVGASRMVFLFEWDRWNVPKADKIFIRIN
jgi:hypothetical protein